MLRISCTVGLVHLRHGKRHGNIKQIKEYRSKKYIKDAQLQIIITLGGEEMKSIGFMMMGAAMGAAAGAAAMAAANCPKVKRACRMAQRKIMSCAHKIGL